MNKKELAMPELKQSYKFLWEYPKVCVNLQTDVR